MLRDVLLDIRLKFKSPAQRAGSEDVLLWFLGVVSRLNLFHLADNPDLPLLYESGVRYAWPDQMAAFRVKRERINDLERYLGQIGASPETIDFILRYVKGVEIFRDIPALYARREGDCDNLTAARVAELWRVGVAASPYLTSRENETGGTTYHALVRHPDGSTEDPSLLLGMGGMERADEREREIRKNVARYATLLQQAQRVLLAQGGDPVVLGATIDRYGLVPRGGFPDRAPAVGGTIRRVA